MIEIKDLHYQYGSSRKIHNGLNLSMEEGKIYGILGQNGAGKSTLLKCICGLLIPGSGKIRIGEWEAKDRLPSFLGDLFFLPEEISNPNITPGEYGKIYGVFYPKFDHKLFKTLCNEFEIPMENKLDEMSYGQKKKTLISFGIACNTRLILMDEPTNGLDIPSKSQFRKIIAKSTNPGNCILISTHQIKDIENLIDHVLIIHEGGILFNQSLAAVATALYFDERANNDPDPYRLYEEESIHGYTVIEQNALAKESKIDLEILFKAVMTNPQLLNHPFN